MANQRGQRGNGSITKTSSGKYWLRFPAFYTADGIKQRYSKVFDTERQAQQQRAKLMHDRAAGITIVPARHTLEAYIKHYLEVKLNNIKKSTYEDYTSIISTHIIPALGFYPLQSLTVSIIDTFLASKLQSLSSGTTQKIKAVLRDILALAKREQLLHSNPVNDSNVRINTTTRRDNIITDEHINAILEITKTFSQSNRHGTEQVLYIIFNTALVTACRIGELLALDFTDIKPALDENGKKIYTLHINKTLSETKGGNEITSPKTQNANRIVPLPDKAAEQLLSLKQTAISSHVFQTRTGSYFLYSNVRRSWAKIMKSLNLKYTLHDIRHTAITKLVNSGCDCAIVSRWAGHSDVSLTINKYYTHRAEQLYPIAGVCADWI